jgi:hypothetical protein
VIAGTLYKSARFEPSLGVDAAAAAKYQELSSKYPTKAPQSFPFFVSAYTRSFKNRRSRVILGPHRSQERGALVGGAAMQYEALFVRSLGKKNRPTQVVARPRQSPERDTRVSSAAMPFHLLFINTLRVKQCRRSCCCKISRAGQRQEPSKYPTRAPRSFPFVVSAYLLLLVQKQVLARNFGPASKPRARLTRRRRCHAI